MTEARPSLESPSWLSGDPAARRPHDACIQCPRQRGTQSPFTGRSDRPPSNIGRVECVHGGRREQWPFLFDPASRRMPNKRLDHFGSRHIPRWLRSRGLPTIRRRGGPVRVHRSDERLFWWAQEALLSSEHSAPIDTGTWTVTAPIDSSLARPARCVVAAQPTHDFEAAGNAY